MKKYQKNIKSNSTRYFTMLNTNDMVHDTGDTV